jgi:putative membrane protein
MNLIWWFLWVVLMIWIFATPYGFRRQRNGSETAFEILQKLFASGKITKEEYQERKKILEQDLIK